MQKARRRRGRSLSFEQLEGGALLAALPNEITSLYSNGFNPTSIHLNGNASLVGTRLRLTDGGQDETSSAFYATPVDVSESFTTSFEFQISPAGGTGTGGAFTFDIQNELGPASVGAPDLPGSQGLLELPLDTGGSRGYLRGDIRCHLQFYSCLHS